MNRVIHRFPSSEGLDPGKKMGLALLAVLVLAALCSAFWPKAKPELVVQEGVQYKLLSYSIAETSVGEQPVSTYVLSIGYTDDEGEMHHGTVMVPKVAIRHVDDGNLPGNLPINTVVWDPKLSLEGRDYQVVRWNPGYSVRAIDRPMVSADQRPLTR